MKDLLLPIANAWDRSRDQIVLYVRTAQALVQPVTLRRKETVEAAQAIIDKVKPSAKFDLSTTDGCVRCAMWLCSTLQCFQSLDDSMWRSAIDVLRNTARSGATAFLSDVANEIEEALNTQMPQRAMREAMVAEMAIMADKATKAGQRHTLRKLIADCDNFAATLAAYRKALALRGDTVEQQDDDVRDLAESTIDAWVDEVRLAPGHSAADKLLEYGTATYSIAKLAARQTAEEASDSDLSGDELPANFVQGEPGLRHVAPSIKVPAGAG